jgi:hypothetical protein
VLYPEIKPLTGRRLYTNIHIHGVYGSMIFLELIYNHIKFEKRV